VACIYYLQFRQHGSSFPFTWLDWVKYYICLVIFINYVYMFQIGDTELTLGINKQLFHACLKNKTKHSIKLLGKDLYWMNPSSQDTFVINVKRKVQYLLQCAKLCVCVCVCVRAHACMHARMWSPNVKFLMIFSFMYFPPQ
jgi:hypothetical protein